MDRSNGKTDNRGRLVSVQGSVVVAHFSQKSKFSNN